MPSFDVVSEVKMEEVVNALDQTAREIGNRYDFKGTAAKVERLEQVITVWGDSNFQITQITDILYQKLAKRGIDVRAVDAGEPQAAGGDKVKQLLTLKNGIKQEYAKVLVKVIKDSGLKVQAQIQGNQLRVTGKKRDDLQECIALLRSQKLEQPLQYENFRD
jgi:cyclic-di-GMP-binding protein